MDDASARERGRILDEYRRREREIDPDRYAPWQASVLLGRVERSRKAAALLRAAGVFPRAGMPCLEVGFGRGGWLAELLNWGLAQEDLYGVDIDLGAVRLVSRRLSFATLAVADGGALPWPDGAFRIVIVSTVFTSILDDGVRTGVAGEISRVIAPGGALLWYDFAFNNPANRHVRRVGRRELRELFPDLSGTIRSAGLAPPLARRIAPVSWLLATALEAIPFVRTHLLAVLVKPPGEKNDK